LTVTDEEDAIDCSKLGTGRRGMQGEGDDETVAVRAET
jgi:hypothetical protein